MVGSPLPSGFTAHNVRLEDGTTTYPAGRCTVQQLGNFIAMKKLLKLAFPEGWQGKSIVDLGCLEGGFTAEFARLGLEATGIEVRQSNLRNAHYIKDRLRLANLHFHQDDAWNIGKYGPFDIVFCVGLYYHIENARDFLALMARNTRRFIFIDTHFAPELDDAPAVRDHGLSALTEHEAMAGRWYPEHDLDSSKNREHLEILKWASWENRRSFWPTRPALVQAMREAGFDMVFEDFDPLDLGAAEAMSLKGWYGRNSRSVLVGLKLG